MRIFLGIYLFLKLFVIDNRAVSGVPHLFALHAVLCAAVCTAGLSSSFTWVRGRGRLLLLLKHTHPRGVPPDTQREERKRREKKERRKERGTNCVESGF